MPKISIVDRNARDYQNWLSPESPDHLTPRAVSSELVLTHEWSPGHHVLEDRITLHFQDLAVSGGAGWVWTFFLWADVADGYVRYVPWCCANNFAGNRPMWLGIAPISGPATQQSTVILCPNGISPSATTTIAMPRPVIIPRGWNLVFGINYSGAGEHAEIVAGYADYRCCEPLPRL